MTKFTVFIGFSDTNILNFIQQHFSPVNVEALFFHLIMPASTFATRIKSAYFIFLVSI